ncbi:MAG TPA: pyridoxamine 5'-phosphate oxidase family protein [Acidimicrobiales bacterium]|nr:pyridoxamine 5'-phosphate oxidase family protein [Acidimicrobiales bacterium]
MTARGERPSVRLSEDEAWDVVAASHTGILTTLRADGVPIALPVWFVVVERTVVMRTPSATKKVARLRRNPTASFLVESGERWAELRAVHLTGQVEVAPVEGDLAETVATKWDEKYAGSTTARRDMPEATRRAYGAGFTLLRMVPDRRILSWDNTRLPLG